MNKPTAAIIQFQKKQESEFLCSACGAGRGCDCNAPALKRLDELEEKRERKRQQDRQAKRREREKDKQKQQPVRLTGEESDGDVGPVEEACADCVNNEERWQRSLSNMAGDAVSLPAYWTREFGNWDQFGCPRELAKLATQAAEAWKQIASELNQRIK